MLVCRPFVAGVHVGLVLGLGHVGLVGSLHLWECLTRAGYGPWNSCVWHGVGRFAEQVHEAAGETKLLSTRTRTRVRRALDGNLPVGDELASDHRGASGKEWVGRPLDSLVSVGEELTSDFRWGVRRSAC